MTTTQDTEYMDIIDHVTADTLEVGDFIQNGTGKVCEIIKIEEDGDFYHFELDNADEVTMVWHLVTPIFGHVYKD